MNRSPHAHTPLPSRATESLNICHLLRCGCLLLVGCWSVAGRWSVVTGCWLLVAVHRTQQAKVVAMQLAEKEAKKKKRKQKEKQKMERRVNKLKLVEAHKRHQVIMCLCVCVCAHARFKRIIPVTSRFFCTSTSPNIKMLWCNLLSSKNVI